MTSQSPRIYTYKITFDEVPYYYYGMKAEKVYDEEYWGSPKTHKWCWKLYTPKKQILETFNSREDADEVERRLIKPVYNTDKWCLNENCGGLFSLDTCSRAGKKGGKINAKNKTGVCGRSKEKMREDGRKGGVKSGKMNGKMNVELGRGIFALSEEEMWKYRSNGGKVSGKKQKELGVGIFAIPPEKVQERNKKNALQRWECLETGFVTNAGNLTQYQKARGIDTSKTNRKRIS